MFWYEFLQEEKKRTGNGLEFPWRALVLLLLSVRSLHMLIRSLTSSCHHLGHQTSYPQFSSVQFSCSVASDSLWPHELQHARPPCPSPTPGACSNSCPSSHWCHPAISSFVIPFSSCLQSFPASGVFSKESVLRMRWPKYWSFSFIISPSNEYLGLISFRIYRLDLLAVLGTLKSLLQHYR